MIKKPSEIVNVENKFRVLVAGHPGIGKTTLGLTELWQVLEKILYNLKVMMN